MQHRPIVLSRDRGCPKIQEPVRASNMHPWRNHFRLRGRSCEELVRGHSTDSRGQSAASFGCAAILSNLPEKDTHTSLPLMSLSSQQTVLSSCSVALSPIIRSTPHAQVFPAGRFLFALLMISVCIQLDLVGLNKSVLFSAVQKQVSVTQGFPVETGLHEISGGNPFSWDAWMDGRKKRLR